MVKSPLTVWRTLQSDFITWDLINNQRLATDIVLPRSMDLLHRCYQQHFVCFLFLLLQTTMDAAPSTFGKPRSKGCPTSRGPEGTWKDRTPKQIHPSEFQACPVPVLELNPWLEHLEQLCGPLKATSYPRADNEQPCRKLSRKEGSPEEPSLAAIMSGHPP